MVPEFSTSCLQDLAGLQNVKSLCGSSDSSLSLDATAVIG